MTVEVQPGPEGDGEIKPTVIFAKDPARRIEVFWLDDEKRTGLSSVDVSRAFDPETYEPAKVQPAWAGPFGLKIGLPIAEVTKANGKAFDLSGFGWDYGGYAVEWKDGALAKPEGGCLVQARFDIEYVEGREIPPEILGDTTLSSDLPALTQAGAKVVSFGIAYPPPE